MKRGRGSENRNFKSIWFQGKLTKEHTMVERKVRRRSLWPRKGLFPPVINDSGEDCPSKGRHVRESTVASLGYPLDKKQGN